jgi:hypothetical protein
LERSGRAVARSDERSVVTVEIASITRAISA